MSEDAFALTPVAAQPPQPSEAVYQALNAALSATARGRWFLSEFAKRNRNSEASKMLDAVARIEQAVAERPALTVATADLALARGWAQSARTEAFRLLRAPDREAAQEAAKRGARIIREIAYSMRAVGNDPRICNILDSQLDAIEAAQRGVDQPSTAVIAAFDRLIAQIDELIPALPTDDVIPAPTSLPAKLILPADPVARLAAVTDLAVACAIGDPNIAPTAAQTEEDDDVLARIALEMASPDDDDDADASLSIATPVAEPDAPQAASQGEPLSLGQSLLAQGLVQPSAKPASDPFASLKRLTQAEKVALFT